MSLLEVSGIRVVEEGNVVLENISFSQSEFQKIAIAGETGSGKSSLLQTIAGLVQPVAGQVLFENKKVRGPHDVLVPGHPGIAYLSQQYELPQFLRVEQILKYANTLEDEEAELVYDICRISPLLKRRTNQLSGGEKQRIALARLLVSSPSLLLLDEPFSNLDMVHKSILKSVIKDISDELGITCILISHDPADTLSWADQIIVMKGGQILQQGTPRHIYSQPINEYVAGLFGKYNLVCPDLAKDLGILPEAILPKKNILIRPEVIKLVDKGAEGLVATVQEVTFYGSHFEIDLLVNEALLTVRTIGCDVQEGEKAPLVVSQEDIWYV
jgi:ABC-type Fe3+/spermidine/putrescine transport system ATPase subunit